MTKAELQVEWPDPLQLRSRRFITGWAYSSRSIQGNRFERRYCY